MAWAWLLIGRIHLKVRGLELRAMESKSFRTAELADASGAEGAFGGEAQQLVAVGGALKEGVDDLGELAVR